MFDVLWNEVFGSLGDAESAARIVIRLVGASLLGAVIGYERERTGHSAGLRTHILVSLSAAVLVVASSVEGASADSQSRVVQGVATGIGFLGAGAIMKRGDQGDIKGLTTAAGIWVTAAIGVAAGLGHLGIAAISVVLAWFVLAILVRFEPDQHDI